MDNREHTLIKSVTKILTEHKCKNCKSEIQSIGYNMREYKYKMKYRDKTIYFCSWNCMRKWQRERGLTPEQLTDKPRRGDHFCDTYKNRNKGATR